MCVLGRLALALTLIAHNRTEQHAQYQLEYRAYGIDFDSVYAVVDVLEYGHYLKIKLTRNQSEIVGKSSTV